VRGEPVRTLGEPWVRGLEVRVGDGALRLACDLVVFGEPRRPAVELAQQAGCALELRGDLLVPRVGKDLRTSAAQVWACGDLVAPGGAEAALASGRVAGLQAAKALGAHVDAARLDAATAAWLDLGGLA
jgi:NADPH-dependent 2,4-dienoyl-CoA reductase/sulfur reductase-like enzyme